MAAGLVVKDCADNSLNGCDTFKLDGPTNAGQQVVIRANFVQANGTEEAKHNPWALDHLLRGDDCLRVL